MENILLFLGDNYLWFVIIAIILILALIGYFVDIKKEKEPVFEIGEKIDENSLKEKMESVDNIGLSEMMNKNVIHGTNSENIQNVNQNNNSSV